MPSIVSITSDKEDRSECLDVVVVNKTIQQYILLYINLKEDVISAQLGHLEGVCVSPCRLYHGVIQSPFFLHHI